MSDGVVRGGYLNYAAFAESLEGPPPGDTRRQKPEKLNTKGFGISATEPDSQAVQAFADHGPEGYFETLAKGTHRT